MNLGRKGLGWQASEKPTYPTILLGIFFLIWRLVMENFRKPKGTEIQKIKRSIPDIVETAQFIYNNLINKVVTYTFDNNQKKVILEFKQYNYMHLCGIRYDNGASAFFKDARKKNLHLNGINITSYTIQKLMVIRGLTILLNEGIQATGRGAQQNFTYEKSLLKTNWFQLAITYPNNYGVPQSLLNLKSEPVEPKTYKVEHILVSDQNGTETKLF